MMFSPPNERAYDGANFVDLIRSPVHTTKRRSICFDLEIVLMLIVTFLRAKRTLCHLFSTDLSGNNVIENLEAAGFAIDALAGDSALDRHRFGLGSVFLCFPNCILGSIQRLTG